MAWVGAAWNYRRAAGLVCGMLLVSGLILVSSTKGLRAQDAGAKPAAEAGGVDEKKPAVDEAAAEAEGAASKFAPDYGFLPVEIFKIDASIQHLRPGDFNGDKRRDLAVVDNGETQIAVLLQREKAPQHGDKLDVNEIADSWRFEKKKIITEGDVETLVALDFDGDSKSELAWIAKNHLHVAWADAAAVWDARVKVRLADGLEAGSWRSDAADVNGDGRGDVVLIHESNLIVVYGPADRATAPVVERLACAASKITHVWVRDVNGDARPDLVFWTAEDERRPVCVRFQDAARRFGPEHRLELPPIRAVDLKNVDGKPGDEILVIERNSNRLRILEVRENNPQVDGPVSPLVYYGLPRIDGSRTRLVATGDVNGDKRLDVVIADSEAALMHVFLQDPKTGLGQVQTFPGLTGLRSLVLADGDGDGKAEVFLASEKEKLLAVSRWKEGRLTFPEALPTAEAPLAICFADLEGRGRRDLIYVVSRKAGGRSGDYALRKLKYDREEGAWTAGDFNSIADVALEGLKNSPGELIAFDSDRDGLDDLLVLAGGSPATFLATDERGLPHLVAASQSDRLGNLNPGQVAVGELDGPAILVSQKNFARRVALDMRKQVKVVDQYNADSPSAEITAAQIVDLDGDKQPEIVLVDSGTKRLRFLKKQNGVYRGWKELETNTSAFKSLSVGDFNSDGRPDLMLARADDFAIAFGGLAGPVLHEQGEFETKLKDCRFQDLVAGDLGGGGEPEIALIDAEKHRLQIVSHRDQKWQGALMFKVFETGPKSSGGGGQPKEMVVADVTGDGLDDLVFLIFNRVILYPQDSGADAKAPPKTAVRAAD